MCNQWFRSPPESMDPLSRKLFKCSSEQRMSPHIIPSPFVGELACIKNPGLGSFIFLSLSFCPWGVWQFFNNPIESWYDFGASITPRIVCPVTFLKDVFDSDFYVLSSCLGDPCSISNMLWSWSGSHLKDVTVTSDLFVSCPGNEYEQRAQHFGSSVSQPDRGTILAILF